MKRLLTFALVLLVAAGETAAQEDAPYLSSEQQPVHVRLGVVYQQYEDEGAQISEVSTPLLVTAPVGQHLGISLYASQASASGDGLADVNGVGDVQLGLSYFTGIGEGSVVASLGLNLPSGKRELTTDEFTTSVLLGRHFFDFRMPGFGQGFNVSPGLIFAFPVGEGAALGLGAAYQYKGPYRPVAGMPDDYDPGDEIVVTGGLDFRLGSTGTFSAEATYFHYLADKIGDEDIFEAGAKIAVTGQVLQYFGPNELRLLARFRSATKSSLPATLAPTEGDLRTLPAFGWVQLRYRQHLGAVFAVAVLGRARFFGETDALGQVPDFGGAPLTESRTLFDVGLEPEVELLDGVRLYGRGLYTLGDLTGFEAGGGLALAL